MKKIIVLLLFLGFLVSCGPHRMRCGPGRCSIEKPNNPLVFNENVA